MKSLIADGQRRLRPRLNAPVSYFVADKPHLQFVSTGCTLLDCALGGGFPLGRVVNVVGDKSTAKTALATEATINFLHQYPKGVAAYRDVEAAYDEQYAEAMGLPVNQVDFGDPENPVTTVEQFDRDLRAFVDKQAASKRPGIYVLDSLDALSDAAEMARELDEGSYGTSKAKGMSALFRKLARKVEQSNVLLLIVSQIREKIGVKFGDKHSRSGGRALDFYASQILFLAHIETLKRTIKKVERPIGIHIRANVKKNKVGLAMRKCDFDFLFGFGIDDLAASYDWLDQVGKSNGNVPDLDKLSGEEYRAMQQQLRPHVINAWREVETTFLPTRRKYE